MSKKTNRWSQENGSKTWTECLEETQRRNEKDSEKFFNKNIDDLVNLYIDGVKETTVLKRAEAIFNDPKVHERATQKLNFHLKHDSDVADAKLEKQAELKAQEQWKKEREALLCTATGIENGHYYWEFNSLEEAWDFRSTLVKLKEKEKLIGGGRDGFYTDMKSSSALRFTVVKLA